MNTNNYIAAVSILLPLAFGLFLLFKKLSSSYVAKEILANGLIFINSIILVLSLVQKNYLSTYGAIVLILISIFSKEYFKKNKRFIFTKQRFYIFLSVFSSSVYAYLVSNDFVLSFCFWFLSGLIVYLFSYFDIFKSRTSSNMNNPYGVILFGDVCFLIFVAMLIDIAYTFSINFSSSDMLLAYSFGAFNFYELVLSVFCLLAAVFSRFFMNLFKPFCEFLKNASSPLSLTIISLYSCYSAVLLLKTLPYFESFFHLKEYICYFAAFMALVSFIGILYEKSLKIIFANIISILSCFFTIGVLLFNYVKLSSIAYFSLLIIVQIIFAKLFLGNKTVLKKRILKKQ